MIRIITTFMGTGLLPRAPGTWGSLAALPFGWLLHGLGSYILLTVAIIVTFFVGLWATKEHTKDSDDHDPSIIVIDEVVGVWIALLPLSFGMWYVGSDPWVFPYPGWVSAFLLFRLFDIWKPWPVSVADRMHTPLGVMLDDVVAGIMAAIGGIILAIIGHMVLL